MKKRGFGLAEVVVAISLAVVLLSISTAEIARQRSQLIVVTEDARARAAVLSTYERLRAGMLTPPEAGGSELLEGTLPIRLLGLEPPAAAARLRAVEIVCEWTSALDGKPRSRRLTALVARGGLE